MLIVALAAGLLMQFFPCCAFAIHSFSKVSATPGDGVPLLLVGCSLNLAATHNKAEVYLSRLDGQGNTTNDIDPYVTYMDNHTNPGLHTITPQMT